MFEISRSDLVELPKVELHRHLELAVRHSTIRELAPMAGFQIQSEADFRSKFLITEPMSDLGSVLNKFLDTQKLLSTEDILERVAFEACEDAYKLEGIRILELRYAPTFVQMGHPELTFEKIHEAFLRGAERAEREFPIAVGFIAIIQRILPVSVAERVVDFVIAHRSGFVGLDLADNEEGFDSKPFAPHFLRAKRAGLKVTIHSGEVPLPKAPRYVQEAVEYLGADRIGHGVQIHRDTSVLAFIRERKIPLELCLTSNYLTQAVPQISDHPFRLLTESGVITTLNTDDPGIFNTDLVKEIELGVIEVGLTLREIEDAFDRAANVSFIPHKKRAQVWPKTLTS